MGTPAKKDPQGTIGGSTYMRRVQLLMIHGLVGVNDDDGNYASDKLTIEQQIKEAGTKAELQEMFEGWSKEERDKHSPAMMKRLEVLKAAAIEKKKIADAKKAEADKKKAGKTGGSEDEQNY